MGRERHAFFNFHGGDSDKRPANPVYIYFPESRIPPLAIDQEIADPEIGNPELPGLPPSSDAWTLRARSHFESYRAAG